MDFDLEKEYGIKEPSRKMVWLIAVVVLGVVVALIISRELSLFRQAAKGRINVVRLMLALGADPNERYSGGLTALMAAASNGEAETSEVLLAEGADIHTKDDFDMTALIWAALNGRTNMIGLLLDNGADIDTQSMYGAALMLAVMEGHARTAKALLDKGADVNAIDNDGKTALAYAKGERHAGIAYLLKKAGAAEIPEEEDTLTEPSEDPTSIIPVPAAKRIRFGIRTFEIGDRLELGDLIPGILQEELVASGKYAGVRGIDRSPKYMAKSQPNVSIEEARLKLVMERLSIQKMFLVYLTKLGTKYHIRVKVLNPDLSIDRIESATTDSEDGLFECMNELAQRFIFTTAVERQQAISYKKARSGMVYIPGGSFVMGSPKGEGGYDPLGIFKEGTDEHPQHEVYVDAFYMDKCEVTNAQYKTFCDTTGISYPSNPVGDLDLTYFLKRPNYPVVNVSWYSAAEYAAWVGKRLPTEAEWEYACRAGTTTAYNVGDNISLNDANYRGELGKDKWYWTSPVGSFAPNAWGLYDMHGNAEEWCSDWYGKDYYEDSPSKNPLGPPKQLVNFLRYRVVRGGSYGSDSINLRSARRNSSDPDFKHSDRGFRCARDAE